MMSRNRLAWAIGLWAAISWGGRVAIVFDIGSAPADRLRIGASVLVAAAAVTALIARRGERPVVSVYALVQAIVWIRSLVVVFTSEQTPGFLVVHTILAAGSLALAAVASLTVWRAPRAAVGRRRELRG